MTKGLNKSRMICQKYLFKLYGYKNRQLRDILRRIILRLEGGEMYSATIREILSKYHDIHVGMYSYGGCFSLGDIAPGTRIGRYCSFSSGVHIFNGNHPIHRKSTHPFFYNPVFNYVEQDKVSRTQLTIGNDVWVGCNAIILPSVTNIGDGAVIGAGSVVTQDIPPFAVVAGNPAKIIKYRFSLEQIQKINDSRWWDKDIEELSGDLESFLHPIS